MAAGGDMALGAIPGLRAAKKLGKALDKAEDVADAAGDVGQAAKRGADGRKAWTATSDGKVLPPGADIDAVPTAAPDARRPSWGQVHSSHPHRGDVRAHAHGPEPGTGRRADVPLDEAMRRIDEGLKSNELRLRRGRNDRGGE
jgi:hypothetical protein